MRLVDDVVLSPKQVEPDSAELNLSEMGLTVIAADWGESGIEGNSIRTSTGQMLVDRQPKATTTVLKLAVREDADVDLPTAAYRLQQKVGEMQRSRRWMRRDFYFGSFAGSLLCLVTGEVTLADIGGWQAGASPDVTLTFVRNPTWYSTEETESATFKEESARELIYALPASKGTADGLKRITVKNLGSVDWRALIWAEESETYQAGPTNELAYAASALTPRGGASVQEVGGVKVVEHAALTAGWLAVLSSEIVGIGHMTHTGPRRMWLRIFDPNPNPEEDPIGGLVELRLLWRPLGTIRWNDDTPIVAAPREDSGLLDLGEVRPQSAALGDQRWEWMLAARALSGSGAVRIHRVYPLPTEQYAVLRAPDEPLVADAQSTASPGTVEDNASIGAAAWTNPSNAKVSDNAKATAALSFSGGKQVSHYLLAKKFGFAIPGSAAITGIVVQVERSCPSANEVTDNAVRVVKGGVIGATDKRGAGYWPVEDAYQTYGEASDLWGEAWTPADINAEGFGAAISAKCGSAGTAQVDHIRVTVYYTEASGENRICFATRSVELRSDGVFRQHPTDDVWGQLVPDGFLPVAKPGGLEGRPSRGILIPSQGDLGELADGGTNKESVVVRSRDGYHFAREAAT